MNRIKNLNLKVIIIPLIVVVALFVFFARSEGKDNLVTDTESVMDSAAAPETSTDIVICDVSGAVKNPKVVELKKGERIGDAIEAAGGLTSKADISNINRAAIVKDGDKILIPEAGSSNDSSNTVNHTHNPSENIENTQTASGKININSADSTALQQIPGVGPVTADKILEYRNQNGSFSNLEELKNINGIGDKTFEKMKDQITL